MRVSIVVPLYNSARHLDALLASFDAQTMPAQQFEVILVDDGSTDDTLARARAAAHHRTNVTVETIPNSGWPGRPRNVGLDRATGEFVFFVDHDDALAPRALECTYRMAVDNGADIVYGKLVRVGRNTHYWPLWARDLGQVDPAGVPMLSLTVHKLFRRELLTRHGIRFVEGWAPPEDHEFMAQALSRARTVSVLASVPTYIWKHRDDGTHLSDARSSPEDYWSRFGQVLATWERCAGPGTRLEAARLVAVANALARFPRWSYSRRPEPDRRRYFAAAHAVFEEHLPESLDDSLPVLTRLRAQTLRVGDFDGFDRLQKPSLGLRFTNRTVAVPGPPDRLRVQVRARCHTDRVAVAEARSAYEPGTAEITVRHRDRGVEWPVHTQSSRAVPGLTVVTDADIDLTTDAFGAPLTPGRWDVVLRTSFLGADRQFRLPGPDDRSALPPQVRIGADGALGFEVAG